MYVTLWTFRLYEREGVSKHALVCAGGESYSPRVIVILLPGRVAVMELSYIAAQVTAGSR